MTGRLGKPLEDRARRDGFGVAGLPFVATVDDLADATECAALVSRIEALGPAAATITRADGSFALHTRVRDNDRVMFDDAALARSLFERLLAAGAIPATPPHVGAAVGLNERFRAYRYNAGHRFAPHVDGSVQRDDGAASELTVLVYLSDGFTGGETAFLDYDFDVVPKRGMALVFEHRMLHAGGVVRTGTKYVLRSDVMVRRAPQTT